MAQQSEGNTGTRDVTYNLVSVIYHALQGAENYSVYARDAEQAGDRETALFFQEAHEQERRRADQAKELLGKHLNEE
jgi:rubrerythrin